MTEEEKEIEKVVDQVLEDIEKEQKEGGNSKLVTILGMGVAKCMTEIKELKEKVRILESKVK